MAGRRISVLDLREVIRRFRLKQHNMGIARELGISRTTVVRYKKIAGKRGWIEEGPLPSLETLQKAMNEAEAISRPGPASPLEKYREKIIKLRKHKAEMRAIYEILKREDEYKGSYSSVRRFIRKIEPLVPGACIRIETPPGEEAQVDFGYAGLLYDPVTERLRKAWVFVMTLCWSRHQYAEVVFDQKVDTWIGLHIRAFEFFGGVPKRIVIDNLKAAIVKACFHDPMVQRSYRELAEHYGFLISPCRIRKPEHKGKVESGVHYVKRNPLVGQKGRPLPEVNTFLLQWIMDTAGLRIHGTTKEKPLVRFEEAEKGVLQPLPDCRYEPAVWKSVKLHPDCHVVFDNAYYSAPCRLVGQALMVRGTAKTVEIYHEWSHLATHPRARKKGERLTDSAHLPPEKVQGLMPAPAKVREEARKVGSATLEVVEFLLGDRPLDRLRGAQGIVRLAVKYGRDRLERACERAHFYDDICYGTIRNILVKGLDSVPIPEEAYPSGPLPRTSVFARKPKEFVAVSG